MSKEIVGEHYCRNHQGNHSHYAEHNCLVCKLQAELAKSETKVKELEGMLEISERNGKRDAEWGIATKEHLFTVQAELAELRKN